MKKLYFLFSFFLVTYAASAQKIRFTDRQNEWVASEYGYQPNYYPIYTSYDKDTTLNGHTYVHSRWGWFREDDSARMVFYRKELNLPEHVLYNYNMIPGDSLVHAWDNNNPDSVFYLHSVDSVMINGNYHLVQHFAPKKYPANPQRSNTVIEGIGQLADIPFLTYFFVDAYSPLSCFKHNGNLVYIPAYGIDSKSCTLGLSQDPKPLTEVVIAPHPANNTSVISLPSAVTGYIRIVNALGQTVMEKELKAASSIVVGTLPAPGVYFYQIAGESGIVASGRMVYE